MIRSCGHGALSSALEVKGSPPRLPAADARRCDELLSRGTCLARDLAERIAPRVEIDLGPVLVADDSGGSHLAGSELRGHGHARVAAAAAREVLVGAYALHGPWE